MTRNVNQYSRDTSTKPMDSVSNTSNPIIGPTTRNLKRFMQTYFKEKSNKQVLYQKFSNKRVINNMNRNVPCKYFIMKYDFATDSNGTIKSQPRVKSQNLMERLKNKHTNSLYL